jgi:hypothetical protein
MRFMRFDGRVQLMPHGPDRPNNKSITDEDNDDDRGD